MRLFTSSKEIKAQLKIDIDHAHQRARKRLQLLKTFPKTPTSLTQAQRRRALALKHRESGKQYKEIGQLLGGVTAETARQLVLKAKEEAERQRSEDPFNQLSPRPRYALQREFRSFEELKRSEFTIAGLQRIPNIGQSSLNEILHWCERFGIPLK